MSFPVTESTLSALALSHWLVTQYGFNHSCTCKLLRTGMNHLYNVSNGEDKYVLRIYTQGWRSRIEVEEEVRLLLHLKESDLPISYPVPDAKGSYVHEIDAPEGSRFAVLFSFAAGKKMPLFSPETSFAIGALMAGLHKATERMTLQRMHYQSESLFDDSIRRVRAFFTTPSDETKFLEATAAYLRKEYEAVKQDQVRWGAVHLDIWFDNLHIDDTGAITLFDFDFCGNGWQCHDIGYFLHQLFNTNQNEETFKEKAEAFFKGYESVSTITEEEKRIFPLASTAVMLFYIGIQCEKFDTWSNIFLNEDHLKRFVNSMKRWLTFNGVTV